MPRTGRSQVARSRRAPAQRGSATMPASQRCAGRQMQGDVAAVVDVGLSSVRPAQQRLQHLVGDGAGDRGHRRDEDRAMRPDGRDHAPRDRAAQQRIAPRRPARAAAAARATSVGRMSPKRVAGLRDRRASTSAGVAERLDDQVDRPVLQVQPAVGQAGGTAPSCLRVLAARTRLSVAQHVLQARRRARRGRRAPRSRRARRVNSIGATSAGVGT